MPVPEAPPAETSPAEAEPTEEAPSEAEVAETEPSGVLVRIKGRVVDQVTAEPVAGAAVFVFGTDIETTSDAQGRFSIEIPTGSVSIAVVHPKFPTEAVIDLKVGAKGVPDILVRLPRAEEVDDLVLVGRPIQGGAASVLAERRKASGVQDAIGSEDIAKSPDGSASAATRRIVGASIVGGQFLFVRGLGGRYSNVRLNGVPMPSTDPDLPGFQLDLFPTALLSTLTITKTFSPDIPGDFAGGSLNVETRGFPEEFMLRLSIGTSVDTVTTGRRIHGYQGGKTDFLGFDDGTRAMPDSIPEEFITTSSRANPDVGFSRDEINEIGRGFPNHWKLTQSTALPNLTLGVSLGDTIKTDVGKLGYFFTVGYRNRIKREIETLTNTRLEGMEPNRTVVEVDTLRRETSKHEAQIGALGTVAYAPVDDHEFSVVSLLTQSGNDQARVITGYSAWEGAQIQQNQFQYVERQLLFNQLIGKHTNLGDVFDLSWQLNTARTQRHQPDTRTVLYAETPSGMAYRSAIGSGEHIYTDLEQTDFGGGVDTKLTLFEGSALKVGYMGRESERGFRARRFISDFAGAAEERLLPPEEIFTPENSGTTWTLREVTRVDDGFDATQSLHAGYGMLELQLFAPLRVAGGVRLESFEQTIEPKVPYLDGPQMEIPGADRSDRDYLPAASTVVALSENMNLRGAYGGTVARPQLRELAPFLQQDFVRRRTIQGNPDLQRTFIHNFDLRWEMFPSTTEVFAVSLFYKIFEDPIESVILDDAGNLGFANIDGANNYGAEFEARWALGLLSESLSDFSALANLALIRSEVRMSPEQQLSATTDRRPLSGQSPYVANLSLGYEPAESPLSLYVYYNVFGRRIQDVGRSGLPDVYEEPFHSLDFAAFFKPDEHWNFGFSVNNLLFQQEVRKQDDLTFSRLEPGLTVNLNAGWSY